MCCMKKLILKIGKFLLKKVIVAIIREYLDDPKNNHNKKGGERN